MNLRFDINRCKRNLTGTMPGENGHYQNQRIKDEAVEAFDPQSGSAVPDKTEPTGATSNISSSAEYKA